MYKNVLKSAACVIWEDHCLIEWCISVQHYGSVVPANAMCLSVCLSVAVTSQISIE